MDLEKELARKLAWAVNSTLNPPDAIKSRVRVWAWRIAVKMVNSKTQFTLTNPPPPPDNGMAGGGAVRVQKRIAPPIRTATTSKEDHRASTISSCSLPFWLRPSVPCSGPCCTEQTCASRSCGRRGGSRCVRRPAGTHDWGDAATAPAQESAYGRRYADCVDDRKRYLEKGG